MNHRRVALAFLVSPIAAPLAVFLLLVLDARHHGPVENVLIALPFYFVYALPVAYVSEILFGAPAWLIFKHYRVRSWPVWLLGGAFIGWLTNAGIQVLPGRMTAVNLAGLFNPVVNPYVLIDTAGAAASAALFRQIVFSDAARTDVSSASKD